MNWLPQVGRRVAQGAAVVDAFILPPGARERFRQYHSDCGTDELGMVESATRQWFRVLARAGRKPVALPALAVERLWQEIALHTDPYEDLCRQAFGRSVVPVPAAAPGSDTTGRAGVAALLRTLALARRDEGCGQGRLPLLFRVDAAAKIPGGLRYLADCGGVYQCFPAPGMTCLRHLGGAPRRRSHWGYLPHRRHRSPYYATDDFVDGGAWDGGGGGDGGGGY